MSFTDYTYAYIHALQNTRLDSQSHRATLCLTSVAWTNFNGGPGGGNADDMFCLFMSELGEIEKRSERALTMH
jgi:hypothetical protein